MSLNRDKFGFDAPVRLGHPIRSGLPDGQSTGPEIGDRLPDFELPNASGANIAFHADRGTAKAAVLFYRSAVW